MSKWLSAEWFDQTGALAADQAGPPGLSARIQVEITGGPDGEVRYHRVLGDGRLTEGAGGTIGHPDVTVVIGWDDAGALLRGELDPNVAFMQGRMKVSGSMGVMLQLLRATTTPSYQELRRTVAAVTEF